MFYIKDVMKIFLYSGILITMCNYLLIVHCSHKKYLSNCISGCKCSDNNHAAVCCLINPNRSINYRSEYLSNDLTLCDLNDNSNNTITHWSNKLDCLPSWRELQIQLTENSWISSTYKPTNEFITYNTKSCTHSLERLVIVGTKGIYDGFLKLNAYELRQKLFTVPTHALKLTRLTVEQTSLQEISPGFLDQIKAHNLVDLEIRRNYNLTDSKIGVGWLANAGNLKSLDLSQNSLHSINFARWGLPSNQPSSITNLDLSGNRITHLSLESFLRLPNLINLNLANNFLSTLPLNVFVGLVHLKCLDLQNNQLKLPGLILDNANLALVLPELRELKLSNNPLLSFTFSLKNSKWWLTNGCPKMLKSIYLENVSVKQTRTNIQNQYTVEFPSINWDLCPSLTDLFLTHTNFLFCLERKWLNLPLTSLNVPKKFQIQPKNLQLCITNITTDNDNGKSNEALLSDVSDDKFQKSHAIISQSSINNNSVSLSNWPISTENTLRVIHLPSTHTFTSWIILSLIVFLLFILFSLMVLAIVYCLKCFNLKSSFKKTVSSSKSHSVNNALTDHVSNLLHTNSAQLLPISLPSTNYPINYFDNLRLNNPNLLGFNPYCKSCSEFKRLLNSRPVSPSDSGLEDSIQATLQNLNNPLLRSTPSSTQTSIRATRRRRRRPINQATNKYPIASSSSLLSQNSNYLPQNQYISSTYWLPSMNISNHTNHVATSTEDLNTDVISTSPTTPEEDEICHIRRNSTISPNSSSLNGTTTFTRNLNSYNKASMTNTANSIQLTCSPTTSVSTTTNLLTNNNNNNNGNNNNNFNDCQKITDEIKKSA